MLSKLQEDKTNRILTTVKLQALFDAAVNPSVMNRRGLAEALQDAGEKISFHGVEAWFKHTDSNYSNPKRSLHPMHKSYAVPQRRWPMILKIFNIPWEVLQQSDDEFRQWCIDKNTLVASNGRERRKAVEQRRSLATRRPSIAVLPFANLSKTAEVDHLVDYLLDDIVMNLSRLPEMMVISRSSISTYDPKEMGSKDVLKKFGVKHMLEGSVRRVKNVFKVSIQLVDTETGSNQWSDAFQSEDHDIDAAFERITLRVCAHLEPKLRSLNMRANEAVESWQFWQLGWCQMFAGAPLPVPHAATELFKKALQIDESNALAHASLATALSTGILWGGVEHKEYPSAKEHAEIAFKLMPENGAVLFGMAMMMFMERTPLTVPLEYMQRAVELEPSNVIYQTCLGYLEAMTGDAKAGVERCHKAIEISPKDAKEPFITYMLSNSLIANGEFEEAIETMNNSRLFASVDWFWIMTSFAYMQLNKKAEALHSLKQLVQQGKPTQSLYDWAIKERLWPQFSDTVKKDYLSLFTDAGIA
jgi:TolB-like protein